MTQTETGLTRNAITDETEDGNVLIRKVRQLETKEGRNTPAIALTAYARVEDRMRALAAGYQMFIPKPVEADELVATIMNLIGQTSGRCDTKSQ